MSFERQFQKPCFGKHNCWNQVRKKCLVQPECRVRAKIQRNKERAEA